VKRSESHVGPLPDDGPPLGVDVHGAAIGLGTRVRASQPLLLSLVDALAGEAVHPGWEAAMTRLGISRRVRFDFARRVSHLLTMRRAHCPRCKRHLGLALSIPELDARVEPTAQDMRPGVVDKDGRVRQLKNLADRCAAAGTWQRSPRLGRPASPEALVKAVGLMALTDERSWREERLSSDSEGSVLSTSSGSSGFSSPAHCCVGPGGSVTSRGSRLTVTNSPTPTLLHASLAAATSGCDGTLGSYLERIVEAAGRRSSSRTSAALERRSWKDSPHLRFSRPGEGLSSHQLLEEPDACMTAVQDATASSLDGLAALSLAYVVRHQRTTGRRQLLANVPFTTAREVVVTLAAAINACTLCRNYLRWRSGPPPECAQLIWPSLQAGILVCTGAGRPDAHPNSLSDQRDHTEPSPAAPLERGDVFNQIVKEQRQDAYALKVVASAFYGVGQSARTEDKTLFSNYLCLSDPVPLPLLDTTPTVAPVLMRKAAGLPLECGNPLAHPDAILSQMHVWDAGRGCEEAWYFNHLIEGAAVADVPRREMLSQGVMEVADLRCSKCGACIGWRFDADAEPDLRNISQVGRVGLVVSSLRHVDTVESSP